MIYKTVVHLNIVRQNCPLNFLKSYYRHFRPFVVVRNVDHAKSRISMSHLHNMTVIPFIIATWIPKSFDLRINVVNNLARIETMKLSNTGINYFCTFQ